MNWGGGFNPQTPLAIPTVVYRLFHEGLLATADIRR